MSEHPEYPVLYETRPINMLKDDILLDIFNYYRLAKETWNVRLGWCKLSHVCRRWRHLILSSAFHLGIHIRCTKDSPTVNTLDHLPPLPLFIDYVNVGVQAIRSLCRIVNSEDELRIYHTLKLRDRVRHINLRVSPSTLDKSLRLMDKPFPILEYLSLSFTGDSDEIPSLTTPNSFLAPNLRHLHLLGIRLPKRLRLLSSTLSLVTLKLTNIQASGYIRPRLLVARLEALSQLEELSIEFSIPTPRPSEERLLLGKQGTPVTLSNLKSFTFRGVGIYLERLISQIRAPVLEELNIILFNQIAFTLTHLSHFFNITEQIKISRTAIIDFWPGTGTSITLNHRPSVYYSDKTFTLHVMCKPSDWQIDCASQISSALVSALSGIESLTLGKQIDATPTQSDWRQDEVHDPDEMDDTSWHELLRSFVRVKELHIDHYFSVSLSRALEVDEVVSDLGLLPDLQLVASDYRGIHANSLFGSFIHARLAAGRPVSLHLPPPWDLPLSLYMSPSISPSFSPP